MNYIQIQRYEFASQDGVKAGMICACSAFLAVYLGGPDSAPLKTGCFDGRFGDMDVLDFVEQNVRVPPRSTVDKVGAHIANNQFMLCDDTCGLSCN